MEDSKCDYTGSWISQTQLTACLKWVICCTLIIPDQYYTANWYALDIQSGVVCAFLFLLNLVELIYLLVFFSSTISIILLSQLSS